MKQFNPTIIKEDFNSETGESYVIINYLGVDFYGKAKCHPEDKEYMGEFTGKSYAYERACIKAMKYELALEKAKCEECRKFVKSCMSYKNFDKTYIKRCRAYDNNGKDFDIEMVFNMLEKNRYISDGNSNTIVVPDSYIDKVIETDKKIIKY